MEDSGGKWATASLRITSMTLTSGEMSQILGTTPHRSRERGESVAPGFPAWVRDSAVWVLNSELDNQESMEAHITKLLEFCEQRHEAILSLSSQCELDIFCGFSWSSGQGTFMLASEMLQRLAKFRIDLVFDLYAPSAQSEDHE